MGDTFNKKLYVHDIATMSDGDILLGDFTPYYAVSIHVEATGLDAADGVVSFLQRGDSTETWKVPTGLSSVMTSTPYSDEFENGNFSSKEVGIRIAHNSCSAGTITVRVTAKAD